MVKFTSVGTVRTLDSIVAQIQDAIITESIPTGERLASERELVEVFGVSRATVREALRTLEALGWVEVRPGAYGGVFPVHPSADQAASALDTLMRYHRATARDLEEFRATFEAETARWAATRATPDDVAELRETVRKLKAAVADPATVWSVISDLDLRWHVQVAEASKNRVRLAVMQTVQRSVQRASLALAPYMEDDIRRSIAVELSEVVEAIAAGDEERAYRTMRDHVTRFASMETDVAEAQADDDDAPIGAAKLPPSKGDS